MGNTTPTEKTDAPTVATATGQRAAWARVAGRKWHWIKDGVSLTAIGQKITPACAMGPVWGNARPFYQGKDTRLSVGVPPNRMKGRSWFAPRKTDHLCQHCVIAAASNGYRFE